MSSGLEQFATEYERAGRNVSAMDLARIKHDVFHDTMDLYVINASNMVEFTTYPPDQDLDFAEPDLDEYLDADPEHQRLLSRPGDPGDRIGYSAQVRVRADPRPPVHPRARHDRRSVPGRAPPAPVHATIEDIKDLNPYVEDVRIFTLVKRQVGNSSFLSPMPMLSARLDRVIANRTGFDWICPKTGRRSGTGTSICAIADYASDHLHGRRADLQHPAARGGARPDRRLPRGWARSRRWLIGLITAGIVSGRLTDPIRSLVGDVNAIAQGDLDHPIIAEPGAGVHGPRDVHHHHDRAAQGHDRAAPAARGEPLRERGPVPPHPRPGLGLRLLQGARSRRNLDLRLVGRDPGAGLPVHVRPGSTSSAGWEAIVHADDRASSSGTWRPCSSTSRTRASSGSSRGTARSGGSATGRCRSWIR